MKQMKSQKKSQAKITEIKNPDRIISYFKNEKAVLFIVTVTGILYNVGMAAGPYFEGQLAQCLYDIIKQLKEPSAMVKLAVIYVLVILLVQVSRAFKRYFVRIFANDISRSMRHILYNSLVHMNEEQLGDEKTGSLMTKAISDVDAASEGMRKVTTEIFDTEVVMVVYIVMLAILDWRLTLLSIIFTPLAYFIAGKLRKKVSTANASYKESASSLNQMTMDRVSNAITYRLFGREQNRNEAYEKGLTDYEKKSAKANIYEGSLTPVYDAISMIGTVMILYFGAKNVLGQGWTAWDVASFTTFLSCFVKLATKTSHAAKLFNAVQKAEVSWKRIKPLMKPVTKDDTKIRPIESVSLSFDNVTCGYTPETTLKNISFIANPGEIIGVTGMVASGKSMLGKVLLDHVPWSGKITLIPQQATSNINSNLHMSLYKYRDSNGNEALHKDKSSHGNETHEDKASNVNQTLPEDKSSNVNEALTEDKASHDIKDFSTMSDYDRHSYITYMGHEPELLSVSVAENIALGDDIDTDTWLKAVCLNKEASAMKDGSETLIGASGSQLSGGQQARLALARTLAHARSIIVLDDPLAAVDKETETQILNNIRELMPDRVILLISHRLYHFSELDHVLFLHDGTADFSDHKTLMKNQPAYADLYNKQINGGNLDE